ncbi:MAG TPA: hypothetical protein VM925_08590 [Labilithrix sp.]|nr:hypothetical protein [Labilithrix sp.]
MKTHSFAYAYTPIVQSGHRVTAVSVVETPRSTRSPIGHLLKHYEMMAADPAAKARAHDAILARYEARRDQTMLIGYDLRIEVEREEP